MVRGRQRLAVVDHSDSPMRAQLASVLAAERVRRSLSMQDFVALITSFADGEKFSYRTYFKTMRRDNNLTLKTISLFSRALDISIAELLFPRTEKWTRTQNEQQIKEHIARALDHYRRKHDLQKKELAQHIGVTVVTFVKTERAEQNLTLDTIEQMADRLRLTPQQLFFGKI